MEENLLYLSHLSSRGALLGEFGNVRTGARALCLQSPCAPRDSWPRWKMTEELELAGEGLEGGSLAAQTRGPEVNSSTRIKSWVWLSGCNAALGVAWGGDHQH